MVPSTMTVDTGSVQKSELYISIPQEDKRDTEEYLIYLLRWLETDTCRSGMSEEARVLKRKEVTARFRNVLRIKEYVALFERTTVVYDELYC